MINIIEAKEINDEIYEILLLADPSRKIVEDYISRGRVFTACDDEGLLGVYVLIKTRPETLEIINIGVKEAAQNKGIGKAMLKDAIGRAKSLGAKCLDIGTGNSSIFQLALYQRVGFRIVGVDRDFFIRHYDEEIWENGIRCVDMIRLSMDL